MPETSSRNIAAQVAKTVSMQKKSETQHLDLSGVDPKNVPVITALLTSTQAMATRDEVIERYCKPDKVLAMKLTRVLIPKVLDQLITQIQQKGIHSVLGMSHVALLVATNIVTMTFTAYSIVAHNSIGRLIMFMASYLQPIFETLMSWLATGGNWLASGGRRMLEGGKYALDKINPIVLDEGGYTVSMYAKLFGVVFATIIGIYFLNRMIPSSKYGESNLVKTMQNVMRAELKYKWTTYSNTRAKISLLMRYYSSNSVPLQIANNLRGASMITNPAKQANVQLHSTCIKDYMQNRLACVTLDFLLATEHILNLHPLAHHFSERVPFDDTTYTPPPGTTQKHEFLPAVTEFLKWFASHVTPDQRKLIIDSYEAEKRTYTPSQVNPNPQMVINPEKNYWPGYTKGLYTMHQTQSTNPSVF